MGSGSPELVREDWFGISWFLEAARMTWVWPSPGLGTVIAVFVFVATLILAFMHMIDVPAALLICAVCAWKL
jgi:hypothetical protein